MERNTQRNGLINLLVLLLAGAVGYFVADKYASLAGQVSTLFMGIGVLVAGVSWFQMRLEERERLEKLEFEELSKSAAGSALFTASETEVFPAQRSREQFERFFVPCFTVAIFLLQAVGGFFFWRMLQHKLVPAPLVDPTITMTVFGIAFLLLYMLGKYGTNLARLEGSRLLRPGAGYLLLSAYLCCFVTAAIAAVQLDFPKADFYLAQVLSAVLMLVALETLVGLVFELYRPRVKGKVERPVYESRLVSLLGQPEGIFKTAAHTLDYQFGFKVSETWFYRFLIEKALVWIVLGQVVILLGSTLFVFIDSGEQGLLERFGKPSGQPLGPGLHVKLPWPIEQVYRYETDRIQSFDVGYTPDPKRAVDQTVLWTVQHAEEQNFLVANREPVLATSDSETNNAAENRPPPVSLLTVSIPVQYQITNLTAWAYNNEEPETLLKDIATREVVHYLVSVDLQDIMSHGRTLAADTLRDRIQAEADKHVMGAHIVFVGLQDIHPPVKVAPDYEKVIAAIHTKEALILAATADAIRTNYQAEAQSNRVVSEALSDRIRREMDAQARAALFTNQIPAYLASPSVYKKREYLQAFARSVVGARKYVLLATNTQDVIQMNLEDHTRADLEESIVVQPSGTGR